MPTHTPKPETDNASLASDVGEAAVYAGRICDLALNRIGKLPRAKAWFEAICEWADEAGIPTPPAPETEIDPDEFPGRRRRRRSWTGVVPPRSAWQALAKALREAAANEIPDPPSLPSLVQAIGLDRVETGILRAVIAYARNGVFENLVDAISTNVLKSRPHFQADPGIIGILVGEPAQEVAQRLSRTGRLSASGVMRIDETGRIAILSRIVRLMRSPETDAVTALFGKPMAASLGLEDFAHLNADVAKVRAILGGALEAKDGVSILFHGVSGAGKTSLAAALGRSLGVPVYAVGVSDDANGEPDSADRLGDLTLARRLLAGRRALILFDEMEDLYGGGSSGGLAHDPFEGLFRSRPSARSRAFVHALLEARTDTPPIVFTANDPTLGGVPFLRRMTAIVEFKVAPLAVRRKLVGHAADAEGLRLPDADLESLARLPAGPAVARSALHAARLAGGDIKVARWAASGVARAMGGGKLVADEPGSGFDPSLVSADVDLAKLAARLAAPGAPRDISLLLSGPPGCGKSAFARHLADVMGLPVLEKRASDLLSKFVGETEAQIAKAFAEASAAEAFLIFDEADSLLAARSGAERSFEVTQVNEMLTWMERHRLPFCATTNLLERIDPAAMRRFLVKARFGWLDRAQCDRAFVERFGMAAPPGLAALDALTPADFALVARRAALEGFAGDPEVLLAALASEQAAKPGQSGRQPIGFVAPAPMAGLAVIDRAA
jgi:transitional endoplasmic reticulum ATPase